MMSSVPEHLPRHLNQRINARLTQAGRVWLFLDYDGTLADFAPTPEHVNPDDEVVALLSELVRYPSLRVAVISGRRLSHVQALVPVSDVLLAGTYGVELRMPGGDRIDRVEYGEIRPVLEAVKPRWSQLIANRQGFFLEDKGWALALHARFADDDAAGAVLAEAREIAVRAMDPDLFRVLGGHKFLEIGPRLAHKGRTVEYLMDRYPWPGALPVYVGDDDKDEEAFGVIQARGGVAIVVASEPAASRADYRLESPRLVRRWLRALNACLAG